MAIEAHPDTFDLDGDGDDDEPTPDRDRGNRISVETELVDLGAYEHVSVCPADFDGDQIVGFADLLQLLANWGPCPAPPTECPWDIDASDDVGFTDLLVVLGGWGPCGSPGAEEPPQSIVDCIEKVGFEEPDKLAACIEAMIIVGTP
ncbi:MAG: hypothetical protein KJO18_09850 [Acidimicrobiia bacterium]|nr:hypothetical protein [Acidimicrobiia bacterium]